MGSKNKGIRNKLIKIYGNKCMIEAAGIRYIPEKERKKIKGYKKFQEKITYHHIKERKDGGKRTLENGALIKGYNHEWLHSLPEEEKEKVNQQIQQYKMNVVAMKGDGEILDSQSITLDFDMTDCITIPVYNNKKKDKKLDRRKYIKEKEERKFKKYHNKDFIEGDNYEDREDR